MKKALYLLIFLPAAWLLASWGCGTGSAARDGGTEAADAGVAADAEVPAAPIDSAAEKKFTAALGLLSGGKAEEASALLGSIAGKMGCLEDYRRLYLARALLALKRPAEAKGELEALAGMKGSRAARAGQALMAECAFLEGRYGEAAQRFEKLLGPGGGPDADDAALYDQLANAYWKAGDIAKAREAFGKLVTRLPERKEARSALEALALIEPGFKVPDSWRKQRVEALEKRRLFAEAAEELELLPVPKDKAQREKHLLRKASLLYKSRKSYMEVLSIALKLARGKGETAEQALLLASRCKGRMGSVAGARILFQLYLKKYPDGRERGEAVLALLGFDMQEGRWKFVAKNYGKLLEKKGLLDAGERREALWAIALARLLDGRTLEALAAFEELRKTPPDEMESMRADYWRAAALERAGRAEEAASAFGKIYADHPLHYYALLSAARLEGLGRAAALPPPVARTEALSAPGDPCAQLPEKARRLVEEARAEMKDATGALIEKHKARPDLLSGIFGCFDGQDIVYRSLRSRADDFTGKLPGEETAAWWKVLYPLVHREEVAALSEEFEVPPLLVLAVMKQESGFNPEVTSSAGAMGLMQLMPATAKNVAQLLGEDCEREDAYQSARNLRYAVFYLGLLLKKFDGSLPLAIGAYNGGPRAMQSWLERGWTDRMDLFVELVPFDQTRNYIRRVFTSLIRYEYLYEGDIAGLLGHLEAKPLPSKDTSDLF